MRVINYDKQKCTISLGCVILELDKLYQYYEFMIV